MHMCMFSCWVNLDSATLWTIAHQAPLSMGFPRQEYWSGLPFHFPGDFPDPESKPVSPALAGGFFATWATWETHHLVYSLKFSNTWKIWLRTFAHIYWVSIKNVQFSSVAQSCLTLCDPMNHSMPRTPPCPSPTPRSSLRLRSSSQWCHPAISSSVVPFSFCPQSLPALDMNSSRKMKLA